MDIKKHITAEGEKLFCLMEEVGRYRCPVCKSDVTNGLYYATPNGAGGFNVRREIIPHCVVCSFETFDPENEALLDVLDGPTYFFQVRTASGSEYMAFLQTKPEIGDAFGSGWSLGTVTRLCPYTFPDDGEQPRKERERLCSRIAHELNAHYGRFGAWPSSDLFVDWMV